MHTTVKVDESRHLLSTLVEFAGENGFYYQVILCSIQLSLIYEELGDQKSALQLIKRAVELSQPEGFFQAFLDAGEAALLLVEEAYGCSSPFLLSLKNAQNKEQVLSPSLNPPDRIIKNEKRVGAKELSQREMEVLKLIGEGLSNKEISQKLFITIRTVKFHLTGIFSKLDVSSRTQAIFKGREKGVI